MDCHDVEDRMAGWLDAELSPSEAELFAQHLEQCTRCAGLLQRMEAQVFPRLDLPDTLEAGFWSALDQALVVARSAQDAATPGAVGPAVSWSSALRVSRSAAFLYAALLCLFVGLAALQSARLVQADAGRLAAELQLERQQRLSASVGSRVPTEPVGLVSRVPYRGSL